MTPEQLKEEQQKLELERVKFEREKMEFEQKKLQKITVAIASVAVIVSGLQAVVASRQANAAAQQATAATQQADTASKQVALSKAQTLEKFIGHLQEEGTKDTAILLMNEFSDHELVLRLADSINAASALTRLKKQGSPEERQKTGKVLDELARRRSVLIQRMFGPDKTDRIKATTELQQNWRTDFNVVSEALAHASSIEDPKKKENKSGIINTLVLIRGYPAEVLRTNFESIEVLASKAAGNGEQTRKFIKQVRDKINKPE